MKRDPIDILGLFAGWLMLFAGGVLLVCSGNRDLALHPAMNRQA